jgi:hypothetical protein
VAKPTWSDFAGTRKAFATSVANQRPLTVGSGLGPEPKDENRAAVMVVLKNSPPDRGEQPQPRMKRSWYVGPPDWG